VVARLGPRRRSACSTSPTSRCSPTFPLLSPGSSDFPLLITPDDTRVYAVTSNDGGNGFPEPQAITAYDAPGLALLEHYGVGAGFTANAGTDARISPDGKFLYTAGSNTTTIVKLDIASDAVVDTVTMPQYGEALNLSPDGAILYAFENGYNSGQLRVHDAATLDLIKTVDTPGPGRVASSRPHARPCSPRAAAR
jgi:DNA-binding beta-propeller fold protein YncE